MSRTEVVINTIGMTFEDVLAVARHDAKVVIASNHRCRGTYS